MINHIKLSNRTKATLVLVVIALVSIFILSKVVSAPSFTSDTLKSLDDKKIVVLKLAASSAAASTALTFIPGDVAMPIANKIADLSTYFIFILCAILLEKMLVAVVGYVAFTYIIPLACLLGIIYVFKRIDILLVYAIKLAIFGIVLFAAIPVSIHVSDLMYASYQATIEQTADTVEENTKYIEEKKEAFAAEDKNWLEKVGDYLSDLTSKIGMGVEDIVKKGEESLNTFLDAIAVLIITACVIPIVVILIFIWMTKILFGFSVKRLKDGKVNVIVENNQE